VRSEISNAIKCGPIPEIRDWRSLPVSELTRAERTMKFCETFLKIPEGAQVGQPLKLEDFQEAFIYSVLDNKHGTRNAIFSVARKNGKSALVACILLSFLVGPEAKQNAQLICGAMSREQASLVFKLAAKMVTLSDRLSSMVKVVDSTRRIIGLQMNTEFKAIAADGRTAQGLSPVLVLIDEVGQISGPQSDFVDALTTSQGAHENPLLIYLSTQASTDADLLSVIIDDAKEKKPQRTVCHLYEAPDDCVITDESAWRMANPALGIFRSEEDLREQIGRAERMPSAENSVRNLNLNQRISTVSPFVSRSVWQANGGAIDVDDDFLWYGGLDLSARTDLTALVLIGVGQSTGLVQVRPYFWTPSQGLLDRAKVDRQPYDVWVKQGYLRTTPGATVDYDYIADEMDDILHDIDLEIIAYDRWRIDVLTSALERKGIDIPLHPFGQGFKDMSPAMDAIEAALLNNKIRHEDHPVLTMCAANAVVTQDAAGNRKLDKHKATGRIDGMVALTMAFGVVELAAEIVEPPSPYENDDYSILG